MLERQSRQQKYQRKSRKALYYNGPDKEEEVETVRTHLQNRRSATGKEHTVVLGMVEGDRPRGRPPRRWSDDIADWCGRSLPEAVRRTTDNSGGESLASTAYIVHEFF